MKLSSGSAIHTEHRTASIDKSVNDIDGGSHPGGDQGPHCSGGTSDGFASALICGTERSWADCAAMDPTDTNGFITVTYKKAEKRPPVARLCGSRIVQL